jgi:hypothetical protein
MELVLIAFVGTLVLMAAELRDLVRRSRSAYSTALAAVAVSALPGRTVTQHTEVAAEAHYDAAA